MAVMEVGITEFRTNLRHLVGGRQGGQRGRDNRTKHTGGASVGRQRAFSLGADDTGRTHNAGSQQEAHQGVGAQAGSGKRISFGNNLRTPRSPYVFVNSKAGGVPRRTGRLQPQSGQTDQRREASKLIDRRRKQKGL